MYYAKIYINNEAYYYYMLNEDQDFRIDDNFNIKYNAFFEPSIIFDDLNNNDDIVIDFIELDILNNLLNDFNELLNENAIEALKTYKELIRRKTWKIKNYIILFK